MDDRDKAIAARAKVAMEQAKILGLDLAEQIGKTSATVSDYLNGGIRIPVVVLVAISNMTGESIEYLATGKRPQYVQAANEDGPEWQIISRPATDFEQRIIGMLRRLPDDSRQRLTDMITTAYFDHMESSDTK